MVSEDWRSHLYFQAPLRNAFNGDFRLLTIQSRKYASTAPSFNATTTVTDDESLHCLLKLANLKKSPPFQAISHACNPHGDVKTILINGAPVPISNNLLLALQHVQRQDEPVTIWIDALCINTADLEEKSAQMSQLGSIFKASGRTFIWLGPAADGSDDAIESLKRVHDESPQPPFQFPPDSWVTSWGTKFITRRKSTSTNNRQPQSPGATTKKDLAELLSEVKPSLISLLQRAYWSRAWSLPELAYSAKGDIVCGRHRMDISHFSKAAESVGPIINDSTITKWLASRQDDTSLGIHHALEHNERADFSHLPALRLLARRSEFRHDMDGWAKPPERSLWSVLHGHLILPRNNDYERRVDMDEDPCDDIRSLMVLATDLGKLGLALDYKRDFNGLCLDISAALLKQSAHPLKLCNANIQEPGLPSWAIQWKKARPSSLLELGMLHQFSACGPADGRFYRADINPLGQLVLKGVVVDTVKKVEELVSKETSQEHQLGARLSEIKRLWGDSLAMESSPYKGEETMQALARIPVADMQLSKSPPSTPTRAGEGVVGMYERALEYLSETRSNETDEAICLSSHGSNLSSAAASSPIVWARSGVANDYLAAETHLLGWVPFITETGYVGLGAPQTLDSGDVVVIPYGSSVPFAMRRVGEESYRLLGEVYLYGIMDGEFMKVHRKETSIRLV
ncbi:hypothetical protein PG995_007802 [Apiospora arundinis]